MTLLDHKPDKGVHHAKYRDHPDNNRQTNKEKSFAVAPSPFNVVKLELGIVFVLGVLLLIGLDSITQDTLSQISLLLVAGLSGMVWIVWRTYHVAKRHNGSQN